ncbi:TPA: hypothetical protein U2C82_002074 [Streptococcus suis]|uniref:Uncharacterized protein n=1 Tax=Streptococcus suis TaxID=1307 RepID=A0A7Y6RS85_STRSU|nr:hypothetical protein [Streptococcus suis]MBS0709430.1 hypothetical protein [Streptococcus suis]MBS0716100.1 hypothetical protein [Streptococcus suis]MBS0718173.1 hypothetical protein [Streptococcus suis]MBS0720217.1 hypothetical protein [Streptococcus suis]
MRGRLTEIKGEDTILSTRLSVEAIGVTLQEICGEWKTTPEQITSNSGALARFDDSADIQIVISNKAGLFTSSIYGVQVYVDDLGDKREVQLVALGNSGLSKILYGSQVVKMSESLKRRDMIAERIMRYSAQ